MELKSHSTPDGKIAILKLTGRFDAYEVPAVKEWLKTAADEPSAQLVVNLAEVHFVDSSALATLVQGMKHCRQHQGDLHLCGLQQPVKIIFELTRLDKAFDIFVSEDDAVSAFAN